MLKERCDGRRVWGDGWDKGEGGGVGRKAEKGMKGGVLTERKRERKCDKERWCAVCECVCMCGLVGVCGCVGVRVCFGEGEWKIGKERKNGWNQEGRDGEMQCAWSRRKKRARKKNGREAVNEGRHS